MDDQKSANPPSDTLKTELSHIAEEMYKKNAELAERNTVLSLLRKIDQIILSAVTDVSQVAQQVIDAISAEDEFHVMAISLCNKEDNVLVRIGTTRHTSTASAPFCPERISLTQDINLITKAVFERKVQRTNNLYDVVKPLYDESTAKNTQSNYEIVSLRCYPLIVRGILLGAMVIGMAEDENTLSPFRKEFLDQLADVVGIALDNALLYEQIAQANERLKQLDKLKDEFVSLASHELRTPMTIIKSYLWLMIQGKRGPITEQQKGDLEKSYSSTERLINLVNDMLNISRIESGRFEVNLTTANGSELVKSTVTELQPRAIEQQINLTFESTITGECMVKVDIERVKQVLINLIGNALKFTPPNGQIKVSVAFDGQYMTTCVADSGKGIQAEDMPKLFQKFGIVGNKYLTKLNSQGTGLGLYLSKSLVELMRGKIWVQSEGEGKGTKFYFTLPLADA